jgi:ribonuclease III
VDASGVAGLERRLGHRFLDPTLLERALTHASYAHEHPPAADHDRLAFLGDAVLGLVVAEHVIAADPYAPVGVLTPRRAEVVSSARLARFALALELPPLLRLGRGEDQSGGRERGSILATTLEAVLGAVYLDGGIDAARAAIGRVTAW